KRERPVGWAEPPRGEAHREEETKHALGGPHDLRSFDPPYVPSCEDRFSQRTGSPRGTAAPVDSWPGWLERCQEPSGCAPGPARPVLPPSDGLPQPGAASRDPGGPRPVTVARPTVSFGGREHDPKAVRRHGL